MQRCRSISVTATALFARSVKVSLHGHRFTVVLAPLTTAFQSQQAAFPVKDKYSVLLGFHDANRLDMLRGLVKHYYSSSLYALRHTISLCS